MPPASRVGVEISVFDNVAELATAAAQDFLQTARDALARRGRFGVSLAGGQTPRAIHRQIVALGGAGLPWDLIHVFFGDERCVPPDHPDSNHRMAVDSLLRDVPIPTDHIHRFQTELDPHTAAAKYEIELRTHLPVDPTDWPVFDLIFLGLGSDGHTASLFPGTAALAETHRWAVPNWVSQLGVWRLTLTFPVFNAARRIVFAAAGADKAGAVARVLGLPTSAPPPAERIHPGHGHIRWLLDAAATS